MICYAIVRRMVGAFGAGALAVSAALQPAASFGQALPVTPAETLTMKREPHRVASGQKFFGDAKFVGAETCKSCHARQHDEWRETWHAKMERLPSTDVIVGDFNNRTVNWKGIRIRDKDGKETQISPSAITSRKGDKFYRGHDEPVPLLELFGHQ